MQIKSLVLSAVATLVLSILALQDSVKADTAATAVGISFSNIEKQTVVPCSS